MRRNYRKRSSGYLLPFFLLVGVGIIAVLAFQLWSNLQVKSGDVYFYIASGKAKLLEYGMKDWEDAYSGTKLRAGDSIRTLGGGRLVLEFYNGTKVRMNEDTQLTLVDVFKNKNDEKITMALDHGVAWINHVASEDVTNSHVAISTSNLSVRDTGTVFSVERNTNEVVRVMKGAVKVNIFAEENKKDQMLPPVDVGIGQEIALDSNAFKALRNDENPSILVPFSDTFRNSEWYSWNMREDLQPTRFSDTVSSDQNSSNSRTVPAQNSSTQTPSVQTSQIPSSSDTDLALPSVSPSSSQSSSLSTAGQTSDGSLLEIVQPAQKSITIKEGKFVFEGKVDTGIHKIVVRQNFGGASENYVLKKFKAGDRTFSYNLVEEYGNLKPGDNFYEFSGYDANDKKVATSDEITIHYQKTATQITDTLSVPKILSFNGAAPVQGTVAAATVTVGVVKVVGEIHGAQKVVISGYTLTKYQPGATQWIFYANENGGNLKPGPNEYEVYGIDSSGKESEHVKFSITYNKSTETSPPSATQNPVPAILQPPSP